MSQKRKYQLARNLAIGSMTITIFSLSVVAAGASVLQPATEAVALSKALADAAALDVTRLALQVALISIIANVALVGIVLKLATRWAQKPCVLENAEVVSALRKLSARDG